LKWKTIATVALNFQAMNLNQCIFLTSDSEESKLEGVNLPSARQFCEVNTHNPSPASPRFPFFTKPGIHMSADTSGGILEFLELFFDNHFLNIIAMETK
jgi:hypothetical protein